MKILNAVLLLLVSILAVSAGAQSISDTTPQTNTQQTWTALDRDVQLTAASWDFTGQTLPLQIGYIEITLTLDDAESDVGEVENGQLVLYLDGIDTGLVLDGFSAGLAETLTISGTISPAVSAQLLTALADNQLAGVVHTNNPTEVSNEVFVGNLTSDATTTLTLAVVPEPSTYILVGCGAALLFAWRRRRS